jgi:hypothetical protein
MYFNFSIGSNVFAHTVQTRDYVKLTFFMTVDWIVMAVAFAMCVFTLMELPVSLNIMMIFWWC